MRMLTATGRGGIGSCPGSSSSSDFGAQFLRLVGGVGERRKRPFFGLGFPASRLRRLRFGGRLRSDRRRRGLSAAISQPGLCRVAPPMSATRARRGFRRRGACNPICQCEYSCRNQQQPFLSRFNNSPLHGTGGAHAQPEADRSVAGRSGAGRLPQPRYKCACCAKPAIKDTDGYRLPLSCRAKTSLGSA